MKNLTTKLLFVFAVLFSVSYLVFAQPLSEDPFVNNSPLFLAGDNVNSTEALDGTAFQLARNLKTSSQVKGILFSAGENVWIQGESEYLFAAGSLVNVSGKVEKEAFMAGATVMTDASAVFGRDVYAAGETISLAGNFGRDVRVAGNNVILSGEYAGDVIVGATKIEVDSNAKILGTLKYSEGASLTIKDGASVAAKTSFVSKDFETSKTPFWAKLGMSFLFFLNSLVVAILIALLLPRVFNTLSEKNLKISLKVFGEKFGKGFLVLFLFPIIFIIALFSMIGIASGLVALVIYMLFIYFGQIFGGYILGREIISKLFKAKPNHYSSLIVGLLVLFLVKLIPIYGSFIVFVLVGITGIGLAFDLLRSFGKDNKKVTA